MTASANVFDDSQTPDIQPSTKSDLIVDNPKNIDDAMQSLEMTTPSIGTTAYNSFKQGEIAPYYGIDALHAYTTGAKLDANSDGLLQGMQATSDVLSRPGISGTQKAFDWVANLAGTILNPTTLLGGELATVGVKGAIGAAADYLPEEASAFLSKPITSLIGENSLVPKVISETGQKRIATIGETGTMSAQGIGVGATTMIPQEIADNYNQDTNSINWGGVVKGTVENGGQGLLIPAIPFAVGTIWKKVFGRESSIPQVGVSASDSQQFAIDKAVSSGKISQKEADFIKQYQENPDQEELKQQATQLMAKRNMEVDSTGSNIKLNLLSPSDWQSINNAMWDSAASDGEVSPNDSTNIIDFIARNRMDDLLAKNDMRDGIQSVIDFMQNKEDAKIGKLKEANDIIDKHMLKHISKFNDMSQDKILRALRTTKEKNIPFTVPDEVQRTLNIEKKINELKERINPEEQDKNITNEIQKLEESKPETLSPKDELNSLRQKFLGKKGLPDSYKYTDDYSRLSELAHHWPHAASLLDRVHLEDDYQKQNSYRTVLQSIKNMMDAPLEKLADPSKVNDYLRQKVEALSPDFKESGIEEPKETAKEKEKQEENSLDNLEQEVRSVNAKGLKDAFRDSKLRYDEFQGKKTVFQNLISCIMG